MKKIVIGKNDINQRLDSFLKKNYPKLSLSALYKAIRTKQIKVNQQKAKIDYRLKMGDVIETYLNDVLISKVNDKLDFLLASPKIDAIYEDDNILLVNKPKGLLAHEDNEHTVDNLINRIKHYLYAKKDWDYENENSFVPALVNRIDRNTGGIVIAAKNAAALKILNDKLKDREIGKYYKCSVHGIIDPKQGILRGYLTKCDNNIVKVTNKPLSQDSKPIITAYQTISHDNKTSELEVELVTGKTHQIRAHFASIGHPLVGERKYTIEKYSRLNNKDYQDLTSYKVVFNFKTDAGILNYLKNKSFTI